MASLEKGQMRDIVINSDYVNFLLKQMEKYSDSIDVPEILYYEVLYTSKYLKKHGIIEEARTVMGVWLDSVDLHTLTDEKVTGIEKKQIGSRKVKLKEYKQGGIGYYLKENKGKLFIMTVLLFLLVIPKDFITHAFSVGSNDAYAVKIGNVFQIVFTLLITVLFCMNAIGLLTDIMYISLPVVRIGIKDNLVSQTAVLSLGDYAKEVNATTVSQKKRYLCQFDEYSEIIHNLKPRTYSQYDKLTDIELEINEKGETSDD